MERDLYEIIGVRKDSTPEEIKSAYKKKAVELHPDKNPDDPEAANKFAELSNAYEVLSDPERRRIYDSTGSTEKRDRNSFEARFMGMIGNLLFVIIQSAQKPLNEIDVIGKIIRSAEQAMKLARVQMERNSEEVKQYRDVADRMMPKEDNPFIIILESKIKEIEAISFGLEEELGFTEKAIDRLNDFKYKYDNSENSRDALLNLMEGRRRRRGGYNIEFPSNNDESNEEGNEFEPMDTNEDGQPI
jgi:curved DNA-binding protein CbpA